MKKQKLVVVVGPTASGKTGLAINIAKQFHGEVISADSRQVYRGLDIGTAKATEAEMQGVPHHLIDIVDIDTVYTADRFKKEARKCITEITAREHLPIVAGGTFFYVDTLLGRIAPPKVSPNPELRAALEKKTVEELFAELEQKDPRRATTVDPKNKRRIIRSLEIIEALGSVPETEPSVSPYLTLTLGINTDPDTLRERLKKRAQHYLDIGFKEEVEVLLETGVKRERLAEIGFEYLLGLDLIDGKLSEEKFIEVFVQKNWQYAKRQLTWLKRDQQVNWVSASDKGEIEMLVQQFLMHN